VKGDLQRLLHGDPLTCRRQARAGSAEGPGTAGGDLVAEEPDGRASLVDEIDCALDEVARGMPSQTRAMRSSMTAASAADSTRAGLLWL
jgi:hypothetical protein